jgi:hypothetical protein
MIPGRKAKEVRKLLEGKDPKSITWFFFDRALILAKEAGMDKKLLHERIDAVMK